ncbi:MAG: hypothetical protein ACREBK_03295 [Sphingomicrobium sp.]
MPPSWWVKARLGDRTIGWLKLKSDEDIRNFPMLSYKEVIEAWDIHRIRDDETPDCPEMLAYRQSRID